VRLFVEEGGFYNDASDSVRIYEDEKCLICGAGEKQRKLPMFDAGRLSSKYPYPLLAT
jgi:hypothetical protein